MLSTTTVEFVLPTHALSDQVEPLQRSVIRHVLKEGRITMPEAMEILNLEDQRWLIETIIQDAQESLLLTAQLSDMVLRNRYWTDYGNLLSHLFHWHEQWSTHHTEMLAVLRMVPRRYLAKELTTKRAKLMQMLTERLNADNLYHEDVFAAEHALKDVGWDTLVDLTSISEQLLPSYLEDIDRA